MEYRISQLDGKAYCTMSGELTFSDHSSFRQMLNQTTVAPEAEIVFDLGNISFIDSAGLGMLLVANEEAGRHNKSLFIENVKGQVAQMLDLAQMGKILSMR